MVSRKVDDLGRVVIPKEIRKNVNIHNGDKVDKYLIEKASEIGISKIVPIIYTRSVVKELSTNKIER